MEFKNNLNDVLIKIAHMCNKNIVVNFIPQKIKQDRQAIVNAEEIHKNNFNILMNFLKENITSDYQKVLSILFYKELIDNTYHDNNEILANYFNFYRFLDSSRVKNRLKKAFEKNNIPLDLLKELYQDFKDLYIFETHDYEKIIRVFRYFDEQLMKVFFLEIKDINFDFIDEETFQKFNTVVKRFAGPFSTLYEEDIPKAFLIQACIKLISKK